MSASRTLILLAGGQSRRMGRDKAALPADTGTLLERIITRLTPVVDDVIVAGGPPPSLADVHWVADARSGGGPLAGIAAGLAAMPGELGWAVACDLPDVEPRIGELLFASATIPRSLAPVSPSPSGGGQGGGGGYDAIVPRVDGKPQGLCAVYRRTLADRILALLDAGERRVTALLDAVHVRYLDAEELRGIDPELRSFRNVNTPDEYQAWLRSRG